MRGDAGKIHSTKTDGDWGEWGARDSLASMWFARRWYFLAGTRSSLASIAHPVQRGETVDSILDDFPALESREKVEGAISFVIAHQELSKPIWWR